MNGARYRLRVTGEPVKRGRIRVLAIANTQSQI
ncbi:MAG: hypothetical protein HW389_1593 [Bacteroidetes bacterium]|jgi:hypothetical protein|nr:hypothetical protein [Bacteroidota bacterium]